MASPKYLADSQCDSELVEVRQRLRKELAAAQKKLAVLEEENGDMQKALEQRNDYAQVIEDLREENAQLKAQVAELKDRPARVRLPDTRQSVNRKFKLPPITELTECPACKHRFLQERRIKLYTIFGLYPDGKPGEIFISADKVGSFESGMMHGLAIAVSLALQHGCPHDLIAKKFTNQIFDPRGVTGDPEMPLVKSPLDAIGRFMLARFGGGKAEEEGGTP